MACTIIIGNDRCNAVVKSKYRHEEKTLQFEVNTKYCSCSDCELYQDQIHAVGHDRTDGLHDDRWNTYCINMADDLLFRPEALKGQMDLVVSGGIQDKAQDQGNDLPGDSGQGRSGCPHVKAGHQEKVSSDVKDAGGGHGK